MQYCKMCEKTRVRAFPFGGLGVRCIECLDETSWATVVPGPNFIRETATKAAKQKAHRQAHEMRTERSVVQVAFTKNVFARNHTRIEYYVVSFNEKAWARLVGA